jgi:Inner membrane protein YgaP-like, transmembrane domain
MLGWTRLVIGRIIVNVDRAVLALAGSFVLISLALAWLVSAYWLLFTAFVGANMLQAAFTGFCPAAVAFRWLGLKEGAAFRCQSTEA